MMISYPRVYRLVDQVHRVHGVDFKLSSSDSWPSKCRLF